MSNKIPAVAQKCLQAAVQEFWHRHFLQSLWKAWSHALLECRLCAHVDLQYVWIELTDAPQMSGTTYGLDIVSCSCRAQNVFRSWI